MQMDIAESSSYVRQMAVTHKDFFRILPQAMGQHNYSVDGLVVRGSVDGGTVTITIGPEQVRKIALMVIPYCDVEFRRENVSDDQYDEFKRHFQLRYQRGGG